MATESNTALIWNHRLGLYFSSVAGLSRHGFSGFLVFIDLCRSATAEASENAAKIDHHMVQRGHQHQGGQGGEQNTERQRNPHDEALEELNAAQALIKEERVNIDQGLRKVVRDMRFNLYEESPVEQRKIMRAYGFKFTTQDNRSENPSEEAPSPEVEEGSNFQS